MALFGSGHDVGLALILIDMLLHFMILSIWDLGCTNLLLGFPQKALDPVTLYNQEIWDSETDSHLIHLDNVGFWNTVPPYPTWSLYAISQDCWVFGLQGITMCVIFFLLELSWLWDTSWGIMLAFFWTTSSSVLAFVLKLLELINNYSLFHLEVLCIFGGYI